MERCRSPKPCNPGSSPGAPAKFEVVVPWSAIMAEAKECGKLRLAGKFKEADEKEKALEDFVINRVSKVIIPDVSDIFSGQKKGGYHGDVN